MKRVLFSALILVAGTMARADYAPFQPGNRWEFTGSFTGTLYLNSIRNYLTQNYSQKLVVIHVSSGMSGDTLLHVLDLLDSVFQRSSSTLPVSDSVMRQTLTLAERNGAISIRSVAGDSLFSHQPVLFLSSLLPGTVSGASSLGIYNGYAVVAFSGDIRYVYPTQSWYVDDVGLYWSRERTYPGACENYVHELRLSTFNGRAVDLGIEPPQIAPMMKGTEIACTEIHPIAERNPTFRTMRRSYVVDAAGRTHFPGRGLVRSPALMLFQLK